MRSRNKKIVRGGLHRSSKVSNVSCSRCRGANFCSREIHCDQHVALKAEFHANQEWLICGNGREVNQPWQMDQEIANRFRV